MLMFLCMHLFTHMCMCTHARTHTHILLTQDRMVEYSQIHYTVHFLLLTEIIILYLPTT